MGAPNASTREITAKNFEETIEKGGIVLLDWWAPWCGPCRSFAPIFEKTSASTPPQKGAVAELSLTNAFEVPLTPRDDVPGVPNFARVSDVLYRGAQPTHEGFLELKKLGVRTVVSLRQMHSDRDMLSGTG